MLSSFPTEEEEEEVVLLAELCLRLRLTSNVLLSLDTELEVVEAKVDCVDVCNGFDCEVGLPLAVAEQDGGAVSSVGRCS